MRGRARRHRVAVPLARAAARVQGRGVEEEARRLRRSARVRRRGREAGRARRREGLRPLGERVGARAARSTFARQPLPHTRSVVSSPRLQRCSLRIVINYKSSSLRTKIKRINY